MMPGEFNCEVRHRRPFLGEYGNTSRNHVWLDDLPIAVADKTGTTVALDYVHADGLRTPRAVSDATGTTVWTWPYAGNPFGEQPPTSAGGYTLNLRYPGQYFDTESGLSNWGYRSYEAATGRSPESDPLGVFGGQPSTYAYVDNQPLMYEDLLGLAPGHHEFPQSIWRGLQNLSRDASRLFDDAVINPAMKHGWSKQHAAYNRIAKNAWDRFCKSTRANANEVTKDVAQDFLGYLRDHPEIAKFNEQIRTGEPLTMPDEAAPYPELPGAPAVPEPPVVEPTIIEPPVIEPIIIP